MIKKFIRRITTVGFREDFSESDNKLIVIINTIDFVLLLVMLCWITLSLLYYSELRYNLWVFIGTASGCLFSFYLTSKGRYLAAKTAFLLIYSASIIGHIFILSVTELPIHLFFIPTFLVAVFTYKKDEKYFEYLVCFVSIFSFIYFEFFGAAFNRYVTLSPEVSFVIKRAMMLTLLASLTLLSLYISLNFIKAEDNLEVERKRNEDLLLNILPKTIANRLKLDPNTIADGFSNVTILFADIVGFTDYASTVPPDELVASLNDIFTKFDSLAQKYNLEKIKTIGDCYMVACGLPEENIHHATLITNFALDVLDVIKKVNETRSQPLILRIGINSGPVVAGVIGKKKFIYDLWGDTVNTASRMESHGIPGEIQIAEPTFQLIKDEFNIEKRGEIQVKGKGLMMTYLVKSRIAVFC